MPRQFLYTDLDHLVSRDDRDSLVPILDFDRVQTEVQDISIRAITRDFNPIALFDKIVGRNLNAGHDRREWYREK